jgi:septal ring factor EnvC (AmiA/AmiB activator)
MKRIRAVIAAVMITGLVGLGMLAIGANAALNPNTVAVSNAPGDPPAPAVAATSSQTQTQINHLQDLIAQYQNREKQYQAELNQAKTQLQQYQSLLTELNQADTQLQQYQALLAELQRRGLIRVNSDGSIQLRQRGFGSGDDGG